MTVSKSTKFSRLLLNWKIKEENFIDYSTNPDFTLVPSLILLIKRLQWASGKKILRILIYTVQITLTPWSAWQTISLISSLQKWCAWGEEVTEDRDEDMYDESSECCDLAAWSTWLISPQPSAASMALRRGHCSLHFGWLSGTAPELDWVVHTSTAAASPAGHTAAASWNVYITCTNVMKTIPVIDGNRDEVPRILISIVQAWSCFAS